MKYAVQVSDDIVGKVTYLRNTEYKLDQIASVNDPDFLPLATFASQSRAATEIARFAAQYPALGAKWWFRVVRVVHGVVTTEELQ